MESRIADTKFPEHMVEVGYLNKLITMAKFKLSGGETLPDDIRREYELSLEYVFWWKHIHRRHVDGCSGDMPIRYPNGKHEKAVRFFDALTDDLAKWLQGETPNQPITSERLEEGRKHQQDIEACYRQRIWY